MKMKECREPDSLIVQSCFSPHGIQHQVWIDLPVAAACNIECRYSPSQLDRVSQQNSPLIMTVDEALDRTGELKAKDSKLRGALVSGPGEPLANAATYILMRKINWAFPELALGIATNGLLLRDRIEQIIADGVRNVAIKINACSPGTAKKIYSQVLYKGRRYPIEDAAEFLLRSQWEGLMLAVDAGLHVSVNTLFISGVNEDDVEAIAHKAGNMGAGLMHLITVEPDREPGVMPDANKLATVKHACSSYLPLG